MKNSFAALRNLGNKTGEKIFSFPLSQKCSHSLGEVLSVQAPLSPAESHLHYRHHWLSYNIVAGKNLPILAFIVPTTLYLALITMLHGHQSLHLINLRGCKPWKTWNIKQLVGRIHAKFFQSLLGQEGVMLCHQWNLAADDKVSCWHTTLYQVTYASERSHFSKWTPMKEKQLNGKLFVILTVLLNDTIKAL